MRNGLLYIEPWCLASIRKVTEVDGVYYSKKFSCTGNDGIRTSNRMGGRLTNLYHYMLKSKDTNSVE